MRVLWSALTFLTRVNDVECAISVLHASGTIKKAQLFAIQHDRKLIDQYNRIISIPH
jgi:RNase P/RNase MRP subunit POP5